VLKIVNLIGVVLGRHVHYLELVRFGEVLEGFLGILDPTVFDD
jgi:hypothetical protein